jgi:transcriptional regulator with XRE-family HTH domain
MQRFGEKLRALRKQRAMTIIDLATALGYTANSYISELERGKKKPTTDLVFKVAKLFNVTTDQLLDDALDVPGITAADTPSEESAAIE